MPSKRKAQTSSSGSAKKMKAEDFVIKAKRAPKDPNAPKNPKSAYMFFATNCRAELVKKKPGLSFTDTGREIGKRWQALSDKQKTPWEKKSSDDKARYEKAMKTYIPDEAYAAQQKKMKAQGPKLAKDPDKPKQGRTAYLVFCDAHRAAIRKKYPKKSMMQVSAALAEQWRSVSAKERGACDKTAEKEKGEYQWALANYVPSAEYRKAVEMIQSAKAAVQAKDKTSKGKVNDRVKTQRVKVKELQKEISLLAKKLAAKQAALAKAEEKLDSLVPGALAPAKPRAAGGAKKKVTKKKAKAAPKKAKAAPKKAVTPRRSGR